MKLNSRVIGGTALVLLMFGSTLLGAQQDVRTSRAYPERPVRIIEGSAPGSGGDNLIRRVTPRLGERLGTYVVVDNRPGAVGAIAVDLASQATADGYTVLMINGQSITGMLLKQIKVDIPKAFIPIVRLSAQAYLVIANTALPAGTIKELIVLAKAKPGALTYASSGVGGQVHLGMELLNFMAGTQMLHVPYRGSSQVVTEVMAGRVQLAITNVLTAGPLVRSGRLKALAVTALQRIPVFPGAPTVADSGLPELTNWHGLFAPSGTPQAIVNKLNAAVGDVMNSSDVKREFVALGVEAAPPHAPGEFRELIAREVAKWDTFLKKTPIKFE
ncbi:MAG: tripartite tricarboxylate transporter substrate binding protein [Betaproteobacteria bacterium]|nr:tripartite tricarboxylate transporter substrate binding protein [Betaproteobacteria bacterium]